MKPLTIERCWWKSTVVMKPRGPEEDDEWEIIDDGEDQEDLVKLYNQIKNTPQLALLSAQSKHRSVHQPRAFIAPSEEVIVDDEDVAFETIVERYSETDPAQMKTLNQRKYLRYRQTKPSICLRDFVGMNFNRRME